MKKIIVATVLAAVSSSTALAADLGARTPYIKAPAMVAVSSWSGFYIGANVGYGWGNADTRYTFLPSQADFGGANTTVDNRSRGVIGGGQIGYNWQVGSLLGGIEADLQGSGLKGSSQAPGFNLSGVSVGTLVSSEKVTWFGTVRGRLGLLATPDVLLYATAGLAYGQIDASADDQGQNGNRFPGSVSKINAGWTAGAGAEWMLARHWSAKLEYLYLDLGNVSAFGAQIPAAPPFGVGYTWKTQDHIVRGGVNYHF